MQCVSRAPIELDVIRKTKQGKKYFFVVEVVEVVVVNKVKLQKLELIVIV